MRPDNGQKGKQEETQESQRNSHQNTGKETKIAQWDAEDLPPCLGRPNLLQVLLRIHNWPRKGICTPSTQLEY